MEKDCYQEIIAEVSKKRAHFKKVGQTMFATLVDPLSKYPKPRRDDEVIHPPTTGEIAKILRNSPPTPGPCPPHHLLHQRPPMEK